MKLPQNKYIKWNYLAIAFAIPFFGLLFVMLCGGYEPFGNNRSMLYSDMYHQYYPFFVAFRNALRSGDSLLYNWDIGMGLDYLGLISYYLASPLNLVTVLLPESWMLEYFSLLVPVKLGLASLFFAIFLKNTFHKNDLSIALFGGFYGLCAWALGYQWNVMWLDTFALLPLVALGTVQLLRDKKFILYTVTLFLSIYSNYYIGLFTCIFVLLLFICYEICRFRGFGRLLLDLVRIACFSLLAIGMTAILELPALAALQTTHSSVNKFPAGFRLNIVKQHDWKGLFDAMRQVAGNMGGGITPSFKEGLPNLYCGVGSIVLAFLFLSSGKIRIRDKICSVVLLLFFMLSFIIRQLDYIWHGFHFTNMIPYRFSFLYSFVLLYMAYRSYLRRRHFKLWQIIVAGVLTVGILACSDKRTDLIFLAYNIVFLGFYLCVLIYPCLQPKLAEDADKQQRADHQAQENHRRQIATMGLAGVMVVELILTGVNFGVKFPYTGISNYPKGTEDMEIVMKHLERTEEDLFYRTEVTHAQTLNDGALNGYHGISTFTSSANVKTTEFMRALGYGAKNSYNRYCYEEASPVANLFLGLKYMIERDGALEKNPYFDEVYFCGDVSLLENNAYLPLGFLAEAQLVNIDFAASGDVFTFQNKLLNAASGVSGNAWTKLPKETLTITATDEVTLSNAASSGFVSYETSEKKDGSIYYTYTADRSGFMCIHLTLPKKNKITISLNGKDLYSETYSLPQTLSVSQIEPGDVVEIRLECKKGDKSSTTISAAVLDEALFRNAYQALSASTLELTSFSNTNVEGTISCNRDGLLYTSIPQNGNWHVLVDGKEVEIALIGNVMIGVPMTAGEHTVQFIYRNPAFSLGWKISLGCAVIFIACIVVKALPKQRKGKFEKES